MTIPRKRLMGVLLGLTTLLVRGEAPAAAPRPPWPVTQGWIEVEAEQYHAIDRPEDWATVATEQGVAMKPLDTGRWTRALRYDLQFADAGTYRLWVRARKNPAEGPWRGNDIKVFLFPAEVEQTVVPGHYPFEVGLQEQREFRWLDWAKNSPSGRTDLVVPKAGLYHFYLVGGAGEEWGWEIDAFRLTRDNQHPPAGGDAPYEPPPQP